MEVIAQVSKFYIDAKHPQTEATETADWNFSIPK